MDPYYEQRLIDEVIYLHSLWHQGPPRNPNPNPYHYPYPNLNPSRYLQPSHPTQFKKENTSDNPGGKKRKKGKKRPPQSEPPPVSDLEWPCQEIADVPSSSASGWPTLKPSPTPTTRLPSTEEQARFAATQAQQKALTAAQEFLAGNVDSDGDADDDSDEDDAMDEDGYEEYQFFLKLFTEVGELRGYYEKNCESGEFYCLVCCGIGKKMGKRFKHCVALVQHSMSVAKTKKKRAHRAYAQVMCKVLGWDIDRLPSIVLSLAKPVEFQENSEVGIGKDSGLENVNSSELILKEVSDVGQEEELPNSCVPGTSNAISDNVMLCENSVKVGDANKCLKNPDNGDLNLADGNTEGEVNCLEHSNDAGVGNEIFNNQKGIVVVNDLEGNNGIPN